MNDYNYLEAMECDVEQYIADNYPVETRSGFERNEFKEILNDECWVADSVTGNGSGSYTFSSYEAEEYLCHNMELLAKCCDAFGEDMGEAVEHGAEYCDVTIRCYLLSQAIENVVETLDGFLDDEE